RRVRLRERRGRPPHAGALAAALLRGARWSERASRIDNGPGHRVWPPMKVKMILPALTEATSPFWRPIKYSLFPPLGLATLAAYLDPDVEISLQDEHVEKLDLNDQADLVIIQVYITNAYRAYRIADHYRACGSS